MKIQRNPPNQSLLAVCDNKKCDISSFVTDFASVLAWVDSEGTTFPENTHNGKQPTNSHI